MTYRIPTTDHTAVIGQGIEIVCNAGILVGDEEQSSSPADPLFWPIHPTIERLYQWKMLNGGELGLFKNSK